MNMKSVDPRNIGKDEYKIGRFWIVQDINGWHVDNRDETLGCFSTQAEAEYAANVAVYGEPATERQINYMIALGVNIDQYISKRQASQIIDAAKAGELGSIGYFLADGSN